MVRPVVAQAPAGAAWAPLMVRPGKGYDARATRPLAMEERVMPEATDRDTTSGRAPG